MAELVIVRPVHFLPGKEHDALRWGKETEALRRLWGMRWHAALRSTIDRNQYLLIQIWESKEAYDRWKASPDRARLVTESARMVVHDATQIYEVM